MAYAGAMPEGRSRRTLLTVALLIFALLILTLWTRSSCSTRPDHVDKFITEAEHSGSKHLESEHSSSEPAAGRAPTSANRQNAAEEEAEANQQRPARASRRPRADVDLTPKQERQIKELQRARKQWDAEYQAELDALQRLNRVPLEDRDRDAMRKVRRRLVALQGSEPVSAVFLSALSPEQLAMWDPPRRRPGEQRSPDPLDRSDLSNEQQENIKDFPKTRRAWQVQNRLALEALREQLQNALLAGDTAAEQEARTRIDELRATQPRLGKILSE